jgi:hypothetical protein
MCSSTSKSYSWQSYRKPKDNRTWHQCVTCQHEAWALIIDDLVKVYLQWKYPQQAAAGTDGADIPSPHPSDYDFSADTVDIYDLATTVVIHRSADSKSPAIDATTQGYLSPVPHSPSLLISIWTLELFRIIQLRKASFSVEAFAKVICDMYLVHRIASYHLCYLPLNRFHFAEDIEMRFQAPSISFCQSSVLLRSKLPVA